MISVFIIKKIIFLLKVRAQVTNLGWKNLEVGRS